MEPRPTHTNPSPKPAPEPGTSRETESIRLLKGSLKKRGFKLGEIATALQMTPTRFSRIINSEGIARNDPVVHGIASFTGLPVDHFSEPAQDTIRDALDELRTSGFWESAGIPTPAVRATDPGAAALVTLARKLRQKPAEDEFARNSDTIERVFGCFNDPNVRRHLPTVEACTQELLPASDSLSTDYLVTLARTRFRIRTVFSDRLVSGDIKGFLDSSDPETGTLVLSAGLPDRTRRFEIAKAIGYALLQSDRTLHPLVSALDVDPGGTPELNGPRDHRLRLEELAKLVGLTLLLPKPAFLADLQKTRFDLRAIEAKYRVSLEAIGRRIILLSGQDALPQFHLLKLDEGGNMVFKAGGAAYSDELFPRRLGICSKWASVRAFRSPLDVTRQLSVLPTHNTELFCVSFVVAPDVPRFPNDRAVYSLTLGCLREDSHHLVYADSFDDNVVEVGGACAVCPRHKCNLRAVANPALDVRLSAPELRFARKIRPTSAFSEEDLTLMQEVASEERARAAADGTPPSRGSNVPRRATRRRRPRPMAQASDSRTRR